MVSPTEMMPSTSIIGMKAKYKFKNLIPKDKMSVVIDLFDKKNKKILTASQFGDRVYLNSYTLFKQLLFNPFITIKIRNY